MLTHCDFVYAGESAKFQMPFINLALVPEFGSTYSIPARVGYLRAAELIQLGQPFDAKRAAELGLVTRVVPDQILLATATETAQKLAEKPAGALQACKRLMREPVREQLEKAAKLENEEFSSRVMFCRCQGSVHCVHSGAPAEFRADKADGICRLNTVAAARGEGGTNHGETSERWEHSLQSSGSHRNEHAVLGRRGEECSGDRRT